MTKHPKIALPEAARPRVDGRYRVCCRPAVEAPLEAAQIARLARYDAAAEAPEPFSRRTTAPATPRAFQGWRVP